MCVCVCVFVCVCVCVCVCACVCGKASPKSEPPGLCGGQTDCVSKVRFVKGVGCPDRETSLCRGTSVSYERGTTVLLAHVRQSRPDSGLGCPAHALEPCQCVPSSLGRCGQTKTFDAWEVTCISFKTIRRRGPLCQIHEAWLEADQDSSLSTWPWLAWCPLFRHT